MRRYVFSEFASFAELTSGETLDLLREYAPTVYLAISPTQCEHAASVIRRCQQAGLEIGLWPLLDDADGRWASAGNSKKFVAYCHEVLAVLEQDGVEPNELLIDLEPPIAVTKRALRGRFSLAWKSREDEDRLAGYVEEMSRRFPVSAAVAPWAASGSGRGGWQRVMGTPVDGLPFERVFMMAYTSLLEGYSRGLLARDDAEALLAYWSRQAAELFGARSAVAIGVVGVGALGDERTYRNSGEMARDVGICTAAGVAHLAVFNLGGVLRRDPRKWLEALSSSAHIDAPPPTRRVRALLTALNTAGRLAAIGDRFVPIRRPPGEHSAAAWDGRRPG